MLYTNTMIIGNFYPMDLVTHLTFQYLRKWAGGVNLCQNQSIKNDQLQFDIPVIHSHVFRKKLWKSC
ncbi:hypothetical protein N7462_000761 [Penicillium macrosclerotiorum]|uniref:uncharacterized protein n=1 Tax=Penicillium macrosclerotiorum TaxID=303699 RepID=UPI002548D661|nr:uncharacterized protein N7462_000761 [Penicillium macrosclerotiorum]KAJ5698756.1 hypothetical protein N7462_000761 [Penicillium macrosclerotiorum]